MTELEAVYISPRRVLLISILVLWAGMYLTKKIGFLHRFSIPAPVTGGLLCSVLVALINVVWHINLHFDLQLRDFLLLVFFSTIGLSADFKLLFAGGKSLVVLSVLATVFLFLQNLVGILVAYLFEGHPAYGLLGGSVSFAGGHGTGVTYGQLFGELYGLRGSMELAMACATFGLILGGLIGGPLGEKIIAIHELHGPPKQDGQPVETNDDAGVLTNMNGMINAVFVLALCLGGGEILYELLGDAGVTLPRYLPSLFVGIIITNTAGLLGFRKSHGYGNALSLWSDVSLTLFLSMSLMSMNLLGLTAVLRPILVVLFLQVLLIGLFSYFVVFRLVGKDYDAAVITAGFAGLGLGATPVGMANMRAITVKFGASAKAFLVIPLMGAFFIDIINSFVIHVFMWLLGLMGYPA